MRRCAALGIWSVLKRGVLANLTVASFGHLVLVIRHGRKKIQYQPGLIEGCLAGTGLALEPGETPKRTGMTMSTACTATSTAAARWHGPQPTAQRR